jgi:SOS-response transcriptional repressor LexA
MSWATNYIQALQLGKTVQFRPRGNSMVPKIYSGDLVTVEPCLPGCLLELGDIVLCRVSGQEYLHLISAIRGEQIQISNNRGFINGWTSVSRIYGKVIKVER